jgi:hypothetical protein
MALSLKLRATIEPAGRVIGFAALLLCVPLAASFAAGADIAPHQALYSLSLVSAKPASGIAGATGAMFYKWDEACDGWTIEQRFRLRLSYSEDESADISSTLVTWESKDGLKYRFNERRTRNGELDEEIHGEAHLDGPDKGGIAEFTKPETATITLAPKVLFPTAHTLFLIERAKAGDQFVTRNVFDGAAVENAGQVSAVIGSVLKPPGASAAKPLNSPLLQRPSWQIRLAFFPADSKSDQTEPDYELGMRLLDNGISQDMKLDYSDYVLRAKLDEIEALPKPGC